MLAIRKFVDRGKKDIARFAIDARDFNEALKARGRGEA